jgi:hypothetical protein
MNMDNREEHGNHEGHEDVNHEEHEDHEGHEGKERHQEGGGDNVTERRSTGKGMRLESPLSPEEEQVMSDTIGAAIEVHRALGPGFLESIYRKAMYLELRARGLSYEAERSS